eukprot:jgi/Chrzof1/3760/Cz13g07260.t1
MLSQLIDTSATASLDFGTTSRHVALPRNIRRFIFRMAKGVWKVDLGCVRHLEHLEVAGRVRLRLPNRKVLQHSLKVWHGATFELLRAVRHPWPWVSCTLDALVELTIHPLSAGVESDAGDDTPDAGEELPPVVGTSGDPHKSDLTWFQVNSSLFWARLVAPNLKRLTIRAHSIHMESPRQGVELVVKAWPQLQELHINTHILTMGKVLCTDLCALKRVTIGRLDPACETQLKTKNLKVGPGVNVEVAWQPSKTRLLLMNPSAPRTGSWAHSHRQSIAGHTICSAASADATFSDAGSSTISDSNSLIGRDLDEIWSDPGFKYTIAAYPILCGCWCLLPRRLLYDLQPSLYECANLAVGAVACCGIMLCFPPVMIGECCWRNAWRLVRAVVRRR